ncbi:MAG: DUF4157 domain-containing protein [Methanotrichaceae archaeon]|nr:DUF4157 domain-containing protein [Methanotrichaceae archaeon]
MIRQNEAILDGPRGSRAGAKSYQKSIDPGISQATAPLWRAAGEPLGTADRSFMEARFGHDFSRIRVHADASADSSARALGSRAYSIGRHIVFAFGQYAPGTEKGRFLLAHELAHSLQQGLVEPDEVRTGRAGRMEDEARWAAHNALSGYRIGPLTHESPAIRREESIGSSLLQPCSAANIALISSGVVEAERLADRAIQGLEGLLSIWGTAPVTVLRRSTSMALARGFNIAFDKTAWVSLLGMDRAQVAALDARDRLATEGILANFRSIRSDLPHYSSPPACMQRMVSGSPCIGCLSPEHPRCRRGIYGYVPEVFIGHPSSALLLCPAFFSPSALIGERLIHEIAHMQTFAARDRISHPGFGYEHYYGCPVAPQGEGPGLSEPAQFMGIADSYRCFVRTQERYSGLYEAASRREREVERIMESISGSEGSEEAG